MTGQTLEPTGAVHVVLDRSDSGDIAPILRRLQNLSAGRACATIKPGPPRLHSLASDLLEALLKRPGELTGAARQGQDRYQSFIGWLIGERISDLFVDRAHFIYGRGWRTVCALAPAYGVRVWLVTAEGFSGRSKEVLRGYGARVIDVDEFATIWAATPAPVPPIEQSFPPVPGDDWTTFADTCHKQLDPGAFRIVQESMHDAVAQTERWLAGRQADTSAPAGEAIGAFLRELAHDARIGGEAVARLRAAQQVLFEDAHINVKITPRPFFDLIQEARLNPATADTLRGYSSTRHAALGVLQLAVPATPADFSALDMDHLASDGSTVRVGSQEHTLPPFAAGIVRAHRAVRHMQAAGPHDPLLVYETRHGLARMSPLAAQRTLNAIGRDTGLRLTRHWNEHAPSSQRNWLWRRGISVQPLRPGR